MSPSWIAVARETLISELTTFSATERFFADFGEHVDLTQWLTAWLYEETKHPSVILKWLDAFGEKFDSRFMLQGRQSLPFMPERMGTLASNVISEMVASTSYLTLSEQPSIDPVFKQICRNVSGDEARHAASFYGYAKKRLARADNPNKEKLEALKVLYFWVTPEFNGRVGHPVNLLANRYMTIPSLQEVLVADSIRHAYENTHKRAIRVFGTLLGYPEGSQGRGGPARRAAWLTTTWRPGPGAGAQPTLAVVEGDEVRAVQRIGHPSIHIPQRHIASHPDPRYRSA